MLWLGFLCGLLTLLPAILPHALNYLISSFLSLHLSWFESMNAAVRIVDNRTTALFVKTKQQARSAFTIMQPAKTKPITSHIERFIVLFSSFCTVVKKKTTYLFYAHPSRKRRWRQPPFISRGAHCFSYIFTFFVCKRFIQQNYTFLLQVHVLKASVCQTEKDKNYVISI